MKPNLHNQFLADNRRPDETKGDTQMEIKEYTCDCIPDVVQFERDLRAEENFWGWEIDEAYIADVTASFTIPPLTIPCPCLPIRTGKW